MDPFIGEIRLLPYSYAPLDWLPCDGRLLPIVQNTALFAVLGTQFGGDGKTTFGLPNLTGRVPVGAGNAPPLTNRAVGAYGGVKTVTLSAQQVPSHTHALMGSESKGTVKNAPNALPSKLGGLGVANLYRNTGTSVQLGTADLTFTGGGQAHDNRMPSLALQYCIAVQGVFPPRP